LSRPACAAPGWPWRLKKFCGMFWELVPTKLPGWFCTMPPPKPRLAPWLPKPPWLSEVPVLPLMPVVIPLPKPPLLLPGEDPDCRPIVLLPNMPLVDIPVLVPRDIWPKAPASGKASAAAMPAVHVIRERNATLSHRSCDGHIVKRHVMAETP
jgi:hypothetical protein